MTPGLPCEVAQNIKSEFCVWCRDFCLTCVTGNRTSPAPPSSTPPPSPPSSSSSSLSTGAIIGIAVGAALLVLLLLLAALGACLYLRKKQKANDPSAPSHAGFCTRYPVKVLREATNGWAPENRIGAGGFGEVYRGVSPHDSSVVWAVKRATVMTNDFKREVEVVASKSHPHIVQLLGYSVEYDAATDHHEQIVIYEFMANGDLEKFLHKGTKEGQLTLAQRMDILIGAAQGLSYLHQFDIVHRDIKPANILLDATMQPKIADFGLVRMTENSTTINPTRVVGTPGYVDPAYSRSRKVTPMADVHSYGVMLLEVLTSKGAIVVEDRTPTNIKDWILPRVESGDVASFRDPHLPADSPDALLLRLAQIALRCTAMPASSRPRMADVAAELAALKREFLVGGVGSVSIDKRVVRIDEELEQCKEDKDALRKEYERLELGLEDGAMNMQSCVDSSASLAGR
eukprot:TRINITY_DN18463_c0_g2_i1.p1 TRINITY_DN18463_c0_g2~~TRINITY_DN18463_c0_g2_i1.p1  ORF type:complete len:492 (+),score=30.16 TRINITY_DN18463_c0_g2_i1:103-1476(+)